MAESNIGHKWNQTEAVIWTCAVAWLCKQRQVASRLEEKNMALQRAEKENQRQQVRGKTCLCAHACIVDWLVVSAKDAISSTWHACSHIICWMRFHGYESNSSDQVRKMVDRDG